MLNNCDTMPSPFSAMASLPVLSLGVLLNHACGLGIGMLTIVDVGRRGFCWDGLTHPIESFKPAGLAHNPSLSVYAERRDLTGMGKMLGRNRNHSGPI